MSGAAEAGRGPGLAARLPDFPWDRLTPYQEKAAAHPGGVVDLSVGTPVDPVPAVIQRALAAAADSPGYPTTHGTPACRQAVVDWLRRRLGVSAVEPAAVLPTIGSKELVAWLPTLLGLGPGDQVACPSVAYPTYQVGARLAGAEPVTATDPTTLDPRRLRLLWLNSPANPTGQVATAAQLRTVIEWARTHGVLVASDECYVELGWSAQPVSVLSDEVCAGDTQGLLSVHSLSKRSNLAGYRAAFTAGDPRLVSELLAVRKHAGLIVPAPVQAALTAALADDEHVTEQRARYGARRERLRDALLAAGFRIDHSEAGLYLWATRDASCWEEVRWFADRGILVAPGDFYGDEASGAHRYVRVAITASDQRVAAAVARLS